MNEAARADAFEKFRQQRWRAGARGIGWEFTFEQWLAMWISSGKWEQRGLKRGQYVMARRGDVGPYSSTNCEIVLSRVNTAQGRWPTGAKPKPVPVPRQFKGWTFMPNRTKPYAVRCRKEFIGCFSTQAEAEAAYQRAASVFFLPRSVVTNACELGFLFRRSS